ncbi:MAG TPA: peptidoglycan bridge formation glycyltransferase FemA/FemB family protein [Ktedonobacteraceae bacterium]|nr:peptidoglycan bridge formation glycyltransferase FemA/FemB family protein [Ktedonobacteraceae bacterium]
MEACIITDRKQWNDFVASSVCCNITQSYEWGQLSEYLKEEPLYLGVVDDSGQLCAAILVFIMVAPIIHRTYFYSPRGPVIEDPASPAMTVLLNFLKAEARKRNAFMLKVEPSVADDNQHWLSTLKRRGFHKIPNATHVRNEWVLDISPDEKTILAGMKDKWRYNIRLAERKGVTIREGKSQADIDTFYEIYQTTSDRDNFFIHPKGMYEDVMRMYGEDGRATMFIAEHQGKAISAIIMLRLGEWSWYMYGASANEGRNLMPNHLLQWTGMRWAKSFGCKYYNFRGIPEILQEGEEMWGVYQFKKGFGGYPIHFLHTHDLVYQPLVYKLYSTMVDIKHRRDERAFRKHQQQIAAEKSASKPKTEAKSNAEASAPIENKASTEVKARV